jgi:hypothetical protein
MRQRPVLAPPRHPLLRPQGEDPLPVLSTRSMRS